MNLKNIEYRFDKMSARKQFHVVRRLTPVLVDLAPILKGLKPGSAELQEEDKAAIALKFIEPLGKALSNLKDEDADFILDNLLDTVSRSAGQGIGYTPIRVNGVMMFQDLEMFDELTLAFYAIKANFANFIPAIRSVLSQNQPQANGE